MAHRLTTVAQIILDTAEQLFVDEGDPFDRVNLSPGPPSGTWCEQLTVHVLQFWSGSPGTQRDNRPLNKGIQRPTPQIVVTTMRCVTPLTDNGPPDSATVQAEGKRHLNDLDVLWYGLGQAIAAGSDPFGCSSARLAVATPLRPDSFAGWQVPIEVTL